MQDLWNAMTGLERFFAMVAIPSTLLLVIQTLLSLFGLGGHDHDTDTDHELDSDHDYGHDHSHNVHDQHDPGLRVFTIRGLVAFFSIFGWCGLVCIKGNVNVPVTLVIASLAGLAAMLSIALLLKAVLKLQSDGTVSLANAVGKSAQVYIRVPAGRAERGKVNVTVQDFYIEADAVTDEASDLTPGREVTVVGMVNQNTLLVAARK